MKILKTLCLLAFAAVMPAMLTSCDDDDEPSSSASGSASDDDDEPSSSASSSSSAPYFGLRDCGKVISSIQGCDGYNSIQFSFVYDGSGRVFVVNCENSSSYANTSYDYNSQRCEVVTEYDRNKIISFDADANGRFNSLTYEYDSRDRKRAYEFKYNSDGNVISVVETHSQVLDGKWINHRCCTYTLIWDGDLLTSVSCTKRYEYNPTYDSEYEVKITYSDVVNKYRIPLCGLSTMLFNEFPNELSIAPSKLPKKAECYVQDGQGEEEYVYACRYTLDDEGFIESEYIEDNADGENYADVRYTYADKEF